MSRLQINPPVVTLYPNDKQVFIAAAAPPPAMWVTVTDSGDIKSDFSLEVDGAGSQVVGNGAHVLTSGLGILEITIDDQCRPTSTGLLYMNAYIIDVNGFLYFYSLKIHATSVEVLDEVASQIYNEAYSSVSGDVYRLEFAAGFRFYRNGVLKHSRVNLGTTVSYPMFYQCAVTEPHAASPSRVPQPRLIGKWAVGPYVTWTAPAHGSLSNTGPGSTTEYSGGTIPGTYTLTGQIEPAADAGAVQRATSIINIPTLEILGKTLATLQPAEKTRFKTNYDAAQNLLVAWSVIVGNGSFTQGEFTAGTVPGPSVVRATASVNGLSADIVVIVPKVISNANGYTAAKISEQIDFDVNFQTMPTYVSAGAVAEGTGNITPGFPPGTQQDDVLLLLIETANEAVSTPSGWAAVADSPQGTGTGGGTTSTRLSIFWKRVAAIDSAPTITDPGDHAVAQLFAFRGCVNSGNPWDVTSGDTGASSTSVSIPGDTTTVANCLVVLAVANATDTATPQTSGYTNADLANLTERSDVNSTQGNGGGFALITGEKASIGAYTATTATLATASVQGRMSIALKPAVPTWSASIGSINSTSGIFTAPSLPGQTAKITVDAGGTYKTTIDFPILETFPRTDIILPWPIDYAKRTLTSEAEDGNRPSRIKSGPRRSFPVGLLVDGVADTGGIAGLNTIRAFWDRHHPGVKFILDDAEEQKRLVVYTDSELRWEYTSAGINIAFRVKEAQ